MEEDEDDVADRLEKELKKDLTSSGTAAASLLRDVALMWVWCTNPHHVDPSATFKQVNGKVVKACATELMLDPSQEYDTCTTRQPFLSLTV